MKWVWAPLCSVSKHTYLDTRTLQTQTLWPKLWQCGFLPLPQWAPVLFILLESYESWESHSLFLLKLCTHRLTLLVSAQWCVKNFPLRGTQRWSSCLYSFYRGNSFPRLSWVWLWDFFFICFYGAQNHLWMSRCGETDQLLRSYCLWVSSIRLTRVLFLKTRSTL